MPVHACATASPLVLSGAVSISAKAASGPRQLVGDAGLGQLRRRLRPASAENRRPALALLGAGPEHHVAVRLPQQDPHFAADLAQDLHPLQRLGPAGKRGRRAPAAGKTRRGRLGPGALHPLYLLLQDVCLVMRCEAYLYTICRSATVTPQFVQVCDQFGGCRDGRRISSCYEAYARGKCCRAGTCARSKHSVYTKYVDNGPELQHSCYRAQNVRHAFRHCRWDRQRRPEPAPGLNFAPVLGRSPAARERFPRRTEPRRRRERCPHPEPLTN